MCASSSFWRAEDVPSSAVVSASAVNAGAVAWPPSLLPFLLLAAFLGWFTAWWWRLLPLAFQKFVNHAGTAGGRNNSSRSLLHMLLPVRRADAFSGFSRWSASIARSAALVRAPACPRSSVMVRRTERTSVEEVVLLALTFFVIWLGLPLSSEGCLGEDQLRVCLVDIGLLLFRQLLVVRLLLVRRAHFDNRLLVECMEVGIFECDQAGLIDLHWRLL